MDYEKKYNAALERAKELHGTVAAGRDFLAEIFPELAESEDEIHRKWILEYLYDGLRKADEQFKDHFKSAIAWLEKQKELDKMIVVSPEVWDNAISDAFENGKKEGEKQKEQKPWKVGPNAYFTPEQKPVDLSEMMVHKEPYIAPIPTPMVADEQKPAEWSEEDEKMLGYLLAVIEDGIPTDTGKMGKIVDWLKSLRPPQYCENCRLKKSVQGWKPSEEQIYSLGTVVKGYDECTVGSVGYNLKSLYEQLKKL